MHLYVAVGIEHVGKPEQVTRMVDFEAPSDSEAKNLLNQKMDEKYPNATYRSLLKHVL